jgi:hypothetical protein
LQGHSADALSFGNDRGNVLVVLHPLAYKHHGYPYTLARVEQVAAVYLQRLF